MTPASGAKPMRVFAECGFIVRLKNESYDLLYQLVCPSWHTKRALFPIVLWDIHPSRWKPLKAFISQCFSDRINQFQRHAVRSFIRHTMCHRTFVRLNFSIGHEVEISVEQESVDPFHRQSLFASFTDEFKESIGFPHHAYLPSLSLTDTYPASLR
jgi:hypothetical protein